MLADARQNRILRELQTRGTLEVNQIADKFGVSAMTIRRDLTALAKAGIVERVHGGAVLVAPETNFNPPGAGRARAHYATTIGMIVPSASYYFPGIIRGAEAAAKAAGVRLILGITNYTEAEELRQVKRLLAGGVDALLVTPWANSLEHTETLRVLTKATIPVIVVERSIENILDEGALESVRSDHIRGAEIAINHLVSLGRKRIALCRRVDTATGLGILEGYERGLKKANLDIRPELNIDLPRIERFPEQFDAAVQRLIGLCVAGEVDAALIHSDADAISILTAAEEAGLSAPADLAVVAYDDEIAALAEVPLTAVAPPKFDVGYQSLFMCLRRLRHNSGDGSLALQRLNLSPTLTIRDSTPPAT